MLKRGIVPIVKHIISLTLMILLGFSFDVHSQESENDEAIVEPVPENVMQEVVRRILVYNFKPVNRKKVVFLAQEGIDESWMPVITNIDFRLLSNGEIEDRDDGVYFFRKPELSNKTFAIGFAFGKPDCEYSGDGWRFRISNNKVRLWLAGGFGGGCGIGSSSGEFSEPGQLNTYPNELRGYEFCDRGRLNGLKLTISTREVVKYKFGADCENSCDYDEKWRISFTYFDNISKESTGSGVKIRFVPRTEYSGTLYSIGLIPKSNISFNRTAFPSRYRKGHGYSAACDGAEKSTHTSYNSYKDRYGLIYSVFREITFTTEDFVSNRNGGDLTSIEYNIPVKTEQMMFVKEN